MLWISQIKSCGITDLMAAANSLARTETQASWYARARVYPSRSMAGASRGGSLGGTTVGRWMAFPPASTCSGNAAYSASVIHYHEQAARVKLGLALAGCNGKNSSKPRLVIDAGIMKEIRDDLEGGVWFGRGRGHVGMSCYYYYTLGRVGVGGRKVVSGSSHVC